MDDIFTQLTDESEGPIPGRIAKNAGKPDFSKVEVRYLVANTSDIDQLETVEKIMTTSLRSLNMLSKTGDVVVFREETNFDKEGNYYVAIKYAEMV